MIRSSRTRSTFKITLWTILSSSNIKKSSITITVWNSGWSISTSTLSTNWGSFYTWFTFQITFFTVHIWIIIIMSGYTGTISSKSLPIIPITNCTIFNSSPTTYRTIIDTALTLIASSIFIFTGRTVTIKSYSVSFTLYARSFIRTLSTFM